MSKYFKELTYDLVGSGKGKNDLILGEPSDIKYVKVSLNKNQFSEFTLEITTSPQTIIIPAPTNTSYLQLKFYDKDMRPLILKDVEFASGSNITNYPKVNIGRDGMYSILYDTGKYYGKYITLMKDSGEGFGLHFNNE